MKFIRSMIVLFALPFLVATWAIGTLWMLSICVREFIIFGTKVIAKVFRGVPKALMTENRSNTASG